ncbi:ABC transporter ATP-binding protein [Parashewanella curva]|uniref:ABC transporter ATP-binding protein n=1 Tax=Parashewanella curva TaxID=2338552 RepID=A0A3L8Q0C0_9GAMM|nr:ABC transporter ATP-binding protein [Parashewanella curva]RLV61146.1 ABC transporter ATP-binding protein [Parashewanella curva]
MSIIVAKSLSKHYGTNKALDQVSFEIEDGLPTALVGPNGAGKTTLFKLICGFMAPTSGEIEILGHKAGSNSLISKMSALPQDSLLDPNLAIITQLTQFGQLQGLSHTKAKHEAIKVLEIVELTDAAKEKPTALSHGMAKRVAIAQSLIGEPELILLDEPTAGIDPSNAKTIRTLITEQRTKSKFLISSHNLDELEKLCDQVLYLDNGQLQQSLSIHQHSDSFEFLTLTLKGSENLKPIIKEIQKIPLVSNIVQTQSNELSLQYDSEHSLDFEVQLLTCLHKKQCQYQSIYKGKRLEDKLFS